MCDKKVSVLGTMNPLPGGGWCGAIKTTIFNAIVRIVPSNACAGDNVPPYDVVVGSSRIGGAWDVLKRGSRISHLLVVVDGLGLSEPMRGTLVLAPCA